MDSFLGQCFYSGSFQRRNLNNLTAQLVGQLIGIDLISAFFQNIYHVYRHDHRNPQLHQLRGEIQVTLNIGTVNNFYLQLLFLTKLVYANRNKLSIT